MSVIIIIFGILAISAAIIALLVVNYILEEQERQKEHEREKEQEKEKQITEMLEE